jgi:hypothetical protein
MKRKEGAFIVATAAIVVGVLALVAFPLRSVNEGQSPMSSTTTMSGGQLAFSSEVSPEGLQLKMMVNSSSMQSDGAISALPSSIQPSASTNYVTVVYTVSALSNSTGFYDSSAPFQHCSGMPMAVGYSAAQVNASDFAPRIVHPCVFLPFFPSSVSVIGMNATFIAF